MRALIVVSLALLLGGCEHMYGAGDLGLANARPAGADSGSR
jgi:hypothetical protein